MVFLAGLLAAGCGSSAPVVTVTLTPTSATVPVGGTQQFTATVSGAADTTVTWSVNGTAGGNSTAGTISTSGLYTAPAATPNPAQVTIKATSNANTKDSASATVTITSGIAVRVAPASATVGTGEMSAFTATVTGTTNTAVTWAVNDTASGNSTVGMISSSTTGLCAGVSLPCALYMAPATVPNSATVTVKATSAADPGQSATAAVTIVLAADPTLTTISPSRAAQGSFLQELYLTGSNFLSTSTVLVNGTPLPVNGNPLTTGSTVFVSTTLLRAEIPSSLLSGTTPAAVNVQRQNGPTPGAVNCGTTPRPSSCLEIDPVRPALIGTSPDSVTQGGGAVSVNFRGGYFSPSVTAEFNERATTLGAAQVATIASSNGAVRSANIVTITTTSAHGLSTSQTVTISGVSDSGFSGTFTVSTVPSTTTFTYAQTGPNATSGGGTVSTTSSRQLSVALSSSDLASPGLFSMAVENSALAQPRPIASVNLAVQPCYIQSMCPSLMAASPTVTTVTVGTQPSAVANNPATGVAVVANRRSNTVSLVDLSTNKVTAVGVGKTPTGVAVDWTRNLAVVANNGDNTMSVVDLASGTLAGPPIPSPTPSGASAPLQPVSVGVNPLTGLALVANQSTNLATILDLNSRTVAGTVGISTGMNPQVAIEPRLNWAVVTPGGAGTVSIVDLGRKSVVASLSIGLGVSGIAINTETERALLTDPTSGSATLFSLLDQTVVQVPGTSSDVAAAVNPLTNIGVTVNPTTGQVSVIDLGTPVRLPLGTPLIVGTSPPPVAATQLVAIDPGSNVAVVANQSNNNVSIISLGTIRTPHVTGISPLMTNTSTTDLPITVIGFGFQAGAKVRLDGTPVSLPAVVNSNGRSLTATIPATMPAMLAGPRRYRLDVQNPDLTVSNGTDFTVIQPVPVGTAPQAVAIDPQRDLAVVTNTGSNNISVVDLTTGKVTTIAVGTNPQGVAVIPRLGRAVVTNRGSNNVSLVDVAGGTVTSTVSVGTEPIGVAVNQDTLMAVVADSGSNQIHFFAANTGQNVNTLAVDQRPVAVAIDPTRNVAAVAQAGQNNIAFVPLGGTPAISARVTGPQDPTAVLYDPASDRYLALSSLTNNLFVITPDTFQATQVRVGINPTSLAYNFNSSTLVTVNTASNTLSVMDFLEFRIRAILSFTGSAQFSVAIHPRTNLAVVVDQANNRALLVPLPH